MRTRPVAWWLLVALEARWRLAYPASVLAGLVLIGWIVVQVGVLRRYFFLQPVLGVAGALVVGLAWWAHRRRSPR